MMDGCALCFRPATRRLLCEVHDNERLAEASAARIAAGTGLTYSNAEEFKQENWIARRYAAAGPKGTS